VACQYLPSRLVRHPGFDPGYYEGRLPPEFFRCRLRHVMLVFHLKLRKEGCTENSIFQPGISCEFVYIGEKGEWVYAKFEA